MPDFMAVWVPLILGTLRNPAESPIRAPPGKKSLGRDWKPPSTKARAPYEIRRPSSSIGLIEGWLLKRWNSSKGLK